MQRLVSYNYKGERQWGVLSADGTSIYPAIDLEETYFIPLAETLGDFIESGEEGLLNLAHALEMNGKTKPSLRSHSQTSVSKPPSPPEETSSA